MDSKGERRIHRIAPTYKILYISMLGILSCIILAAIAAFSAMGLTQFITSSMRSGLSYILLILPVGMIIFLVLIFLPLIFLFYKRANSYIITSPAGIEYTGLHFHLRSPWENLKSIEKIFLQRGQIIAIIFHKKPEILSKLPWIESFVPYPMIPLNEFGDWKHSSLREEIQRYRPDLYTVDTGPSWD